MPGILKRGSSGPEVEQLQKSLNAVGCTCDVDGQFGAKTEQAVKNFQKGFGLDSDGIVGPKTMEALKAQVPQTNT